MHLILASQSIGRKKLLEQLKIPFSIVPSTLDEEKIIADSPLYTLKLRAKLKGEEVLSKISVSSKLPRLLKSLNNIPQPYLILSADSGAILDNELIGKPKDYDDAFRILQKLSGKTHEFVTAVYIIRMIQCDNLPRRQAGDTMLQNNTNKAFSLKHWEIGKLDHFKTRQLFDRSLVTFRRLSNDDIKRYLSIIDYTKFAGGYALYTGQDFITNVKGSLSNVIGLPIEKILPVLRKNIII